MASSMVAITTDGTRFGCASISLTEAGIAVLDGSGSRLGFVPYGSLQYVTPCVDDQGAEDGTGLSGDLQVVAADGSEFSCASLSQTAAGVATLAPSGERTGFVPYETLEYVLPDGETGDASIDCTLPAGVAGAAAGAEPKAKGTHEELEETGETEDADEGKEAEEAESGEETAPTEPEKSADGESDGVWEDAEGEAAERAEESTEPADPEAPVTEVEEDTEGEASAEASAEAGDGAEAEGEAEPEATAAAEREEAGESELKVEWSFGEYDE